MLLQVPAQWQESGGIGVAVQQGLIRQPRLQTLWSQPPGRLCTCPHSAPAQPHLALCMSCSISWTEAPNCSSGSRL